MGIAPSLAMPLTDASAHACSRLPFSAMGCPCELWFEAASNDVALHAQAAALAEIERLESRWSHYRDDSLLGQMEAAAGSGTWFALDDEEQRVFAFVDALHASSGGRFDPSIGPLSALWDFRRARVPDTDELHAARQRVGWQHVERDGNRVQLARTGMRLDFGGVIKEYAADRAAAVCRDAGITHGLVDLGGDLAIIGAHADGSPWRIGIRRPDREDRALAEIDLPDGGLATSGTYARMFVQDGRRYPHLIDPHSGEPIDAFDSVSVRAPDCLLAGAVASVALLLGREAGQQWLLQSGLPHLVVERSRDA